MGIFFVQTIVEQRLRFIEARRRPMRECHPSLSAFAPSFVGFHQVIVHAFLYPLRVYEFHPNVKKASVLNLPLDSPVLAWCCCANLQALIFLCAFPCRWWEVSELAQEPGPEHKLGGLRDQRSLAEDPPVNSVVLRSV